MRSRAHGIPFSNGPRTQRKRGCVWGCWARTPSRLSEPVNDTCFTEIIRRQLHLYSIPHGQTNEPFSHLSRDMGKYKMVIRKLYPKHCSREHSGNLSFSDD